MKNPCTIALALALCLASLHAVAWKDSRVTSPVIVNGHIISHQVFAIFVLPGSEITASFVDATGGAKMTFGGREITLGQPIFAAKSPGLEALTLTNVDSGETTTINVFSMVPASALRKDGYLNGYRIGKYPATPLNGLDIYLPPTGFIEVTAKNADVQVSPNFRLGQFVAKQVSKYPKYIVLRTSLLLKLENILSSLNQAGHVTPGFVIMSGYRTPFYNRAIGNVQYSRHVWGGAADFYIDASPKDGRMDDLNKDGKVDRGDARWLANFIGQLSHKGSFGRRIGGLGVYGSNSAHGPFVHVDVRSTRARW